MSIEEFQEFISYLIKECELLIDIDGNVSTENVRETFKEVMKQRVRNKENREKAILSKNELKLIRPTWFVVKKKPVPNTFFLTKKEREKEIKEILRMWTTQQIKYNMELDIPTLSVGMDNGTNYMELYIPLFLAGWITR